MRSLRIATVFSGVVGVLAVAASPSFAQLPSTNNFDVPGPGDWNNASNWLAGGVDPSDLVPGNGFSDEVAGISNGGIAELTSPALFDVLGVVLGETHDPGIPNPPQEFGTLNISGVGSLRIQDPQGSGRAALRVGDAGRGVLNLSGGSVLADSLSVAGAAESELNLSGDAVLALAGNASLRRLTRIEGPDVTVDIEGDLDVDGAFHSIITGLAHSPIMVFTGHATVAGTLIPSFNGHAPSIGQSWTLIDADNVTGTFNAIDASQAALPEGATFEVTYGGNLTGDVVLHVVAVPEPAGAGLAGAALILFGLCQRRRGRGNADRR